MTSNCNIIDDLLPLYLEDACSQDSAKLVETHLQACPACRKKYAVLKDDCFLPGTDPPNPVPQVTACAKKIRRHRIRTLFLAVFITFLAVSMGFLSCLAVQDMRIKANPEVHAVEDGVYNLTAGDLETTTSQVGNYVLFTNYTQIRVSVSEEASPDDRILLWNTTGPAAPSVILYGSIDPATNACTFTGLSSAQRYMVTYDGAADLSITVSEGRHVSFFDSLGSVLLELFTALLK